ncbi:YadA-like family protein [Neisseria yangbaofengii]|uniref:YadA-like family protein n=1 Tax=Neisseria yangbaofengii TaxID=2709396 RepID=UPI003BA03881
MGVAVGANALSRSGGVVLGSSAETQGTNAVAIGRQAVAVGDGSQAYGSASAAVGKGSLAMGNSATSIGERSIAIGMSESSEDYTNTTNVKAEGTDAIAIGSIARANTDTSISIGRNAGKENADFGTAAVDVSNGKRSAVAYLYTGGAKTASPESVATHTNISIGKEAGSYGAGSNNIAMGTGAGVYQQGENSVAIGTNANNYQANGMSDHAVNRTVGNGTKDSNAINRSRFSVAIGNNAMTYDDHSVAVGDGAKALRNGSVAIGKDAKAITHYTTAGNAGQIMSAVAIGEGATAALGGDITIGINSGSQVNQNTTRTLNMASPKNITVGNFSGSNVYGWDNTVLGNSSGQRIGTAEKPNYANTAFGYDVGNNILGDNNVSVGYQSGSNIVSNSNTSVGSRTGGNVLGANNATTGYGSGNRIRGSGNWSAGQGAGNNIGVLESNATLDVAANTFKVGQNAAITSGSDANVAAGKSAGSFIAGSNNIAFGENAGRYVGNDKTKLTNSSHNLAIGSNSGQFINGNHNVAVGFGAGAGADGDILSRARSLSQGYQATAYTNDSIAVGSDAKAGTKGSNTAVNAIAIGTGAQAAAKDSISIGTGNVVSGQGSGAIGDPSVVQGTNSYSLGNNNAIGSASDNVLILGGQNNVGATATRNGSGIITDTSALIQTQNADRAFVLGYKNTVAETADASDSVIIGNENTVDAQNTMVLGNNVTATADNNVILGANSSEDSVTTTAGQANDIENGTVNGITYGSFAGKPAGIVSVGASGQERQIINVAAGKISADSTDAINGSQLYLTQDVLGNVAETTKNIIGGETTLDPSTGKLTANNIGDTNKNTVHDAIKAAKSTVVAGTNVNDVATETNGDGSKTYTVNAKGTSVSNGSDAVTVTAGNKDAQNVTDYKVDLSQASKDSLAKADTAVQEFTTSVNGTQAEKLNQKNKDINFVNGVGTTARASGSDITFDVNKSGLTTDEAGKVTANTAGDNFATAADVANAINEAAERTEKTTTVVEGSNTHVQSKAEGNNTEYTVSADKATVSVSDALKKTETSATDATTQAVTTDYALDLSDTTKEDIKKGVNAKEAVDTQGLTFTGDTGSTNVEKLGSTVAVNGDENITTSAAGDAITISLNKDIKVGSVTAGNTVINSDGLTINNGPSITNKGIDAGNLAVNNVAPATEDNQAVNYSQLKASQSKVEAGTNVVVDSTSNKDGTTYTVNAWDTTANGSDAVTVKPTIDEAGRTRTYAVDLSDKSKESLAKADTAVQEFTTSVNGTQVETLNQKNKDINFVNGVGTTARASGSDITFDVNKSGLTTDEAGKVTANTAGDNFATAADVANAINEAAKRTEKTTTVVEGSNTHVQSKAEGNNTEYTVSADKATVSVSDALKKTETSATDATTQAVTTDYALDLSDTTKEDIKKGVNAKEAVDTQGLTFTGDTGSTNVEKLGSTVAVNGDENITTSAAGDAITISLNKDIKVGSVTAGNTVINSDGLTINNGPSITNKGIDAGNLAVNNVAPATEDNQAVNYSQLKASQSKVEAGTNVVVDSTSNKDGTTYTVNAWDTTANGSDAVTVKPTIDEAGRTRTYAVDLSDKSKESLAKADTAVQEFTTSVNGTQVETLNQKNKDINFVNGVGTTARASGSNITFDVNKSSLTVNNDGGVVAGKEGDNFATAKAVADAINNSEKTTTAQNTDGNVSVIGTTTGNNTDYVINLKKDIAVDSVTAGDTTVNNNGLTVGNITVNNQPMTVNGNTVNNVNDAINQTAAQAFSPLTFAGDSGDNVERKLGETVNVKGGVTEAAKLSDGNIGVVANGNDTLDIKLAKDIAVDSVTAGDTTINNDGVKNGDTSLTKDGITINNGTEGQPVTLTKNGLDNGGNKITHVKAGEADTDAVNVSQLKDAQAAATAKVEGDQGVTVTPSANEDGSTTYTVAAKTDGVTTKVDEAGNIAAVTSDITTDDKGVSAATTPTALATAGDVAEAINNSGFNVKSGGNKAEGDEAEATLINPGEEVEFNAGKNLTVKRVGNAFTFATADDVEFKNVTANKVTVGGTSLNSDGLTIKDGPSITKTGIDAADKQITHVKAGEADTDAVNVSQLEKARKAATAKVEGDQGVTVTPSANEDGSTTYTVAAKTDGVTTKVDEAGNIAAVTGDITTDDKGVSAATTPTALATAGDVAEAINNSGFNVKSGGNKAEGDEAEATLINPGEEVEFNAGKNLTVKRVGNAFTFATADDVEFKNVTANKVTVGGTSLNSDGLTIKDGPSITKTGIDAADKQITHVKAGEADTDAVNVSQLEKARKAATAKVEGDQGVTVTPSANEDGSTTYTVAAKTDGVTTKVDEAGNIAAVTGDITTDDKGVSAATTPTALATASDVAEAINNSGFNVKSGGNKAEGDEAEATLINPGEEVEFNAGKNLTVKRVGNAFTFATADDVEFKNVTANKVTVGGTSLNSDGLTIKDGPSITKTGIDAADKQITHVKAGEADTDAVNVSQLKDAQAAATAKVEGDQGVTVTPSANEDGSTTYTVAAKTDGVTTKVDEAGNIAAVTSDITTDDKGVSAATTPTALATAGDVAEAINNSGFILTAQGANGSLVKPGSTVDMKNTDGNIVISKSADSNDVVYNLAKDVTVDSVTAGDTTLNNDGVKNGDTSLTKDGITINNGTEGQPVTLTKDGLDNGGNKITNVKAGEEDTDAVNVSQLKAAQAAATTKVAGDRGVTVTSKVNEKDRSTTYTVAAKTDSVTTQVDTNGNIAAITGGITTDGKGNASTTMPNALATAQTVADAINNSGFTAKANGDAGKFISSGDEVNFNDGKNITITRDGANFTVATKDDVDFNTVTAKTVTTGDSTLNSDGLTINNGPSVTKIGIEAADKNITNVAAGKIAADSKDAVNGSQLYGTANSIANHLGGGSTVNADGTVSAPSYTLTNPADNSTTAVNNAGDAISGLNKAVNQPLTFAGDSGDNVNRKLGQTVNVKGGVTDTAKLSDGNIGVVANGSDTLEVKLAKDVNLGQEGSLTTGNTVVNSNGVTIAAPTEANPQNTVSISPIGLNNGGNTITNVAPGKNGTDAVNVNQLVGMGNQLQQNIDNVGKKAYAGVAGAIAQSSIPQVTRPGATGLGIGGGHYGGESAIAIGVSSMSDGGNWIIKGNFSTNTGGHVGVGAGALYQW